MALFLEALFSKCAADLLAGRRGEEDSPALRLLTDASFYEMEAVAQSGACSKILKSALFILPRRGANSFLVLLRWCILSVIGSSAVCYNSLNLRSFWTDDGFDPVKGDSLEHNARHNYFVGSLFHF